MNSEWFPATAEGHEAPTGFFCVKPWLSILLYSLQIWWVMKTLCSLFKMFCLKKIINLNSSSCHCFVRVLSQLCVWLQKWGIPWRLLCTAVQCSVLWLWTLRLNPFSTRWKHVSTLSLPIKWPLHFHSCFFSSSNACKSCLQSRHLLCHLMHVFTYWLCSRRVPQLYGLQRCILYTYTAVSVPTSECFSAGDNVFVFYSPHIAVWNWKASKLN